ncbi:hypothetical protein PR048_015315 [Dryococelus australis]|uniref:Ribosomal protein L33 n=1 Tax=Dryococelus australis TaxID=614101 RepID=A0ABQ9HGM0_9NEOP|nr:hypothetical protein PR048_015315 [Dryococelus australis]
MAKNKYLKVKTEENRILYEVLCNNVKYCILRAKYAHKNPKHLWNDLRKFNVKLSDNVERPSELQ